MKGLATLREPALIALATLRSHKLRSFLTLLGIILSVFALIMVVAFINGTTIYIQDRVANLGSNVFLVNQYGLITSAEQFAEAVRRNKRITWEDYEALRDNSRLAKNVGVEVRQRGTVKANGESLEDFEIRGVTANIGEMDVQEPATGRYITDGDNERRSMVTLIGPEVADRLFPNVDPIGKTLWVDNRPFQVVGVATRLGTALGQTQDAYIYIPIRTYQKIYGTQRSLWINVQAHGAEWVERTKEEVRVIMRARRHIGPNDPDTFGIIASEGLMDLWKQLTGVLFTGAIGIVSIFLVIGGIVIMNVMLASVTERTREIGIRKSLGARRRDILMQFMVESSVMAGLGGAVGVGIAYLLAIVVRNATSVPMAVPLFSVILAVAVSTLVGMVFGVYPASKASRLDPIEALRTEL